MKVITQVLASGPFRGALTLLISLLMVSCATIPELQILYKLPPPSKQLKGRSVALTVDDNRTSKTIPGKGAKEDFKGFSGNISLSAADYDGKEFKVGIFNVPGLMREAFKIKLENLGVEALPEKTSGKLELVIVLKEFSLDLDGWEWKANMSYEASLKKERSILATQIINGQAECYKLFGRDSADTLMGEIFTDMVNALDLSRLFKRAGFSAQLHHTDE